MSKIKYNDYPSNLTIYDDYVSIVNNYQNPKIYELSADKKEINFWFINQNGIRGNIIYRYKSDDNEYVNYEQILYKIDCELITKIK
jgi:hypothetical protein